MAAFPVSPNRGNGTELRSSDVVYRGNPIPNQVSGLHGVSARGDGESPFAFERSGSTRAEGAAPESGHSEPPSITETELPRESSVSERKKDSADVQFSRLLRKPRKRSGAEFF